MLKVGTKLFRFNKLVYLNCIITYTALPMLLILNIGEIINTKCSIYYQNLQHVDFYY